MASDPLQKFDSALQILMFEQACVIYSTPMRDIYFLVGVVQRTPFPVQPQIF